VSTSAIHACTICGTERMTDADWFLIAESRWEDRVKVLQWNDQLAMRPSIHTACSPNHVRELVVHWMTTGIIRSPMSFFLSQIAPDASESFWRNETMPKCPACTRLVSWQCIAKAWDEL
jgi:hypothetical protein